MATGKMNRMQRKELARQLQSANPVLEVMHPRTAGIDVGNGAHYVAVRPDQDSEPVRRFECFTADLHRLADWLEACGVETIAMQSTGVYWITMHPGYLGAQDTYCVGTIGWRRPGWKPTRTYLFCSAARTVEV